MASSPRSVSLPRSCLHILLNENNIGMLLYFGEYDTALARLLTVTPPYLAASNNWRHQHSAIVGS